MDVYILYNMIYDYDCHETAITIEAFSTLDDAMAYFDELKDSTINDYLLSSDCETIEEFERLEYAYVERITKSTGLPHFYIELDEYGHNKLSIVKKNILSFVEEI